jgi:hypothetical protein
MWLWKAGEFDLMGSTGLRLMCATYRRLKHEIDSDFFPATRQATPSGRDSGMRKSSLNPEESRTFRAHAILQHFPRADAFWNTN